MKNERKRNVPEPGFLAIQDVGCAPRDDEEFIPDVACSQNTLQNCPVIDCRRYIFPKMRERGKCNETGNILMYEDAGRSSSDNEALDHDVAGCLTPENIVYTVGMSMLMLPETHI